MTPNGNYRVGLATDLDGTLLRPDLTVSEETRIGLAEAGSRRVGVVFVTGRPPRWMSPVVEATGHDAVSVCANGAVTIDLRSDQIVAATPIDPQVATEVRHRVRAVLGPGTKFGIEFAEPGPIKASGFVHEAYFSPSSMLGTTVPDIGESMLGRAPVKLLARSIAPDHQVPATPESLPEFHSRSEELAAAATDALSDLVTVTHSSRSHLLLEMGALGVTKASGLASVAEQWGLGAAEFSTVGDMPNDIPLLEWSHRSYAVSSAHPSVLAIADEVIPDPEHDGVLQVLRDLCG